MILFQISFHLGTFGSEKTKNHGAFSVMFYRCKIKPIDLNY